MKINRHILDNGLRLVHLQDESTQMVALNVLYNVGYKYLLYNNQQEFLLV